MDMNPEQRLRLMEASIRLYENTHSKMSQHAFSKGKGEKAADIIGDIFDDLSAKIEGRTVDRSET